MVLLFSFVLAFTIFIAKPPPINKGDEKLPTTVVGGIAGKEVVKKITKFAFKKPAINRHIAQKVNIKSLVKEKNTVVDNRIVNVSKDIDDINVGLAKQLPDNRFQLPNGNVYQTQSIKQGSEIWPFSGKGIYRLNRNQFDILRQYNTRGGLTDDFYKWFNQLADKGIYTKNDLEVIIQIMK